MKVDEFWPVSGATVEERGDGYAASYPALYECPRCAAAVPRGSVEKHIGWHDALGSATGPIGFLAGPL